MGILTSQQIARFYDFYRDTEIMFSKEIIKILNLDPRQIYIKCNSGQWPCIINSSSLMLAKIIIGTKGGAYAAIQKTNTPVSLRFFFSDPNGQTMSFFVNAHVTAIDPYMNSTELAIATLTFNSKPPDDLIEMVGRLLETKANALKRKEERIALTAESKRRLSLLREETIVRIQNVPRNCIVRDLSFSGAKLIMMGVAQFLQNKEAVLQLDFDEPRETIGLKGKTVHVEHIEGRKELVAVSLKFDEEAVPISYKVHINNCLTAVRQKMLNSVGKQADIPAQEQRPEVQPSAAPAAQAQSAPAQAVQDTPAAHIPKRQ
ncbi:PilZ domain-containing protein [Treponema sp. HNW]|uniref:PilZN3 domain-containing protein n=1 Tax=Treponema sp. HNW TaxID=3116654 RepID=UPI003D101D6A